MLKAYIKKGLLRLFYGAKKPKARPLPQNPTILVISTTGLGDTLFSLPALQALKTAFPHSFLGFLTTQSGKDLHEAKQIAEEVFVVPSRLFWQFFPFRKKLRKKTWDLIFVFHASERLIFALAASLQPKRLIGTLHQNKGMDDLFTDLAPWEKPHEVDRREEQIKTVTPLPEVTPCYLPRKALQLKGKALLHSLNITTQKPLILIHPGAKDGYKCWPIEAFVSLCHLLQDSNRQILITGGPLEEKLCDELYEKVPFAQKIPCNLSLSDFMQVLSNAVVFIGNDSGPMHLCTSLQVPTVALFCPTDPNVCGPYKSSSSIIIAKTRTCTPCLRRNCKLPFCMYQISPKEVAAKIEEILIS